MGANKKILNTIRKGKKRKQYIEYAVSTFIMNSTFEQRICGS